MPTLRALVHDPGSAQPLEPGRRGERDLDLLRADWDLLFTLRVALPEVRITTGVDEDGTSAWIHDGRASWAVLSARPGGATVHEGGPRRLAAALETAWQTWENHGRPGVYDYGMTVHPDRQCVWLNDPDTGPRWPAAETVDPGLAVD